MTSTNHDRADRMNLTNGTALITGASGGIGKQFAIRLADRGVSLVLVARSTDKLQELRSTLLERHPDLCVDVLTADLADPGAAAEVVDHISAMGRRVDILINNAGVGFHGPFVDEEPQQAAGQIQLNCGSLVDLTSRLLPEMVRARHGVVINVASTSAFQPVATMAVYAATKAFVLSFTEALWWETHDTGVRIMCLCPGATETEFFARTGQQFMTRRRQTPDQVVTVALEAIDKSSPTVVSGAMNSLLAVGYRFIPRRAMAMVSAQMVR
jgi:short-subunit dehydrogenase